MDFIFTTTNLYQSAGTYSRLKLANRHVSKLLIAAIKTRPENTSTSGKSVLLFHYTVMTFYETFHPLFGQQMVAKYVVCEWFPKNIPAKHSTNSLQHVPHVGL